jgi:hypothetical protein
MSIKSAIGPVIAADGGGQEQLKRNGKLNFFSRHQALAAFLAVVCLSAYALGANPFAGQTVAPFDRLLEFPGWSSVHSNRKAVNEERSDIVDSQLPGWITLKNQIRKGDTPLWYPYASGGQPVAFELFNPTFLLFLAVKDNALAYYLAGLAKLVISGFGGYLLLKTFVRWLPSLWGGIVFMLCGFNAAWFFWEQVSTAMWIPWLLWATVMYLKTEDLKWLPAIAVISLLMILGGFPAVAAFGFYSFSLLVLVWNIPLAFAGNRAALPDAGNLKLFSKKTVLPLLAVSIAFLMSAIALLPFLDNMSGVNLSYRTGGGTPFSIRDMLLFFFYENPPQVERTAYIGIPVVLFAAAGIVSLFRTDDDNRKRFIFFNVLLLVLTVSITFGLIPHKLIAAIPVFKNNSWGRLIVVPLLGLAVFSSFGLDFFISKLPPALARAVNMTPANAHRLVLALVVGITLVQFHAQKKLFNNFNAVVPSAWFYPMTPSIRYVKERLAPLQSVIADRSYWFAGTLGGYGIPEWYGHSWRTDREKEVLASLADDPFPSATSAAVDSGYIHYDSPLMDELVIKYLLVSKKNFRDPKTVLTLPEISPSPAPPLPGNSWKQYLSAPDNVKIGALAFLFDTFGEDHSPADVRLTLYKDGHELFSVTVDKKKITDNEWVFFEFPERMIFTTGVYSASLSLPGYTGPGRLTAWTVQGGPSLEINGVRAPASLNMRIEVYLGKNNEAAVQKKWNAIDLEKDIMVLENKQVTNGAYFVKNLDASGDQIDFSGLDITQSSAGSINIIYSKADAGWIVLPMHLHSGWKAYVDGRQVDYETYLGMLPAIPMRGPGKVIFRYEPRSFKTGAALSMIGVFILAIFSLGCVRYGKRRNLS